MKKLKAGNFNRSRIPTVATRRPPINSTRVDRSPSNFHPRERLAITYPLERQKFPNSVALIRETLRFTTHLVYLDGNCLQQSVIYQATITRKDNSTTDTYIGFTANDFKSHYNNHTSSFRHAKHRNSTELSKHIWTLKDNNIDYSITWRILSSHLPYNSSSKRCNLCLKEKFLIICHPDLSTLNKRNELVSSCRHKN